MVQELVSRGGTQPSGRMVARRSPKGLRDPHGDPVSWHRSWRSHWTLTGLFLLLSVALAGPLLAAQDESKDLREHAKAFWEARVKGDWAKVYDFLSESEQAGLTKEKYVEQNKQRGPWRYLNYKMGSVEAADGLGWVDIEYAAEPVLFPGIKPKLVKRWEQWEKEDGKWLTVTGKRIQELPQLPPSLRPLKEEKAVIARAEEFWKAREKNDYAKVYQLCSPSFRKKVPAAEFLGKKALNIYVGHQVLWAEVQEDKATVRTAYEYRPNDPNVSKMDPREEVAMQGWIKVDGQWYLDISD